MMKTIYIGWDSRERAAYDVCRRSIIRRTEWRALRIIPIELNTPWVSSFLQRPVERREGKLWCPISEAFMATEFAISRFVVPFAHRKGWALFIDCDTLVMADIAELFDLADPEYAVMVVKHQQESGAKEKMDGQVQTYYSRKNWSSVVLWNCDHPSNKKLTREALNTWPGRDLHAFKWLADEEIGELPIEWNYLVGVDEINGPAKLLHFTLGGPWLPNWKPVDLMLEDAWKREATEQMMREA